MMNAEENIFKIYVLDVVKKHSIPPELIINSDQTLSPYVSASKITMATKNSKSIPITGLTDKRSITLTFTASLSGKFLPFQSIYGKNKKASLPRGFDYPKRFCLTQNPKH